MKIRRYYGKTIREAIQKVRTEQGPDAVILSNRKVDNGIEIIAAVNFDEIVLDADQAPAAARENPLLSGSASRTVKPRSTVVSGNESSRNPRGPDTSPPEKTRREATAHLNLKQRKTVTATKETAPVPRKMTTVNPTRTGIIEMQNGINEIRKFLGSVSGSLDAAESSRTMIHELQNEIKNIRKLLDASSSSARSAGSSEAKVLELQNEIKDIKKLLHATSGSARDAASAVAKILELQNEIRDIRKLLDAASGSARDAASSGTRVLELQNEIRDIRKLLDVTSGSARAAATSGTGIVKIRDELNTLREILDQQFSGLVWGDIVRRSPVQAALLKQLLKLELSPKLCKELVAEMHGVNDAQHAWRHALAQLANKVPIRNDDILNDGGIVALLGPTGVGKTTTIAKLAARFTVCHGARHVAVITTDNYRIGAHEQLRMYAKILNIPMYLAAHENDLEDLLRNLSDRKLVLIDTAGLCQYDQRLPDQFAMLNNISDKIRKYLVLAGTASEITLEDTIRKYSEVKLSGCFLTKVDEAGTLGNVLSLLIRHKLPVAYVCDGQRVPEDLFAARAYKLVSRNVALMQRYHKQERNGRLNPTLEKEVIYA